MPVQFQLRNLPEYRRFSFDATSWQLPSKNEAGLVIIVGVRAEVTNLRFQTCFFKQKERTDAFSSPYRVEFHPWTITDYQCSGAAKQRV
jgi:hypothetical protein